MARVARLALLLGAMLAVVAADSEASLNSALHSDDQCAAGDENCAVSALQLRAKQQSVEAEMQAHNSSWGNPQYYKNWEASGRSFFNEFTFVTQDEVHGAHQFVDKATAWREGIIATHGDSAILKVGGLGLPYKRKSVNIHTNKAWNPGQSFVALMHYKHLPHGCSVWPGFWAMNSDMVWPQGGELDILEYANGEGSKVSFHTNRRCFLQNHKIHQLIHGGNAPGPNNCETDYFNAHPKLGCRPSQHSHTGAWYSGNPGIMGVEWTPTHVKVFHIPEHQIPADIHAEEPKPDTWDRFIIAYLPFDASCANIAQPQELILNIQLCGDWAGNAFAKTCSHARSGGCNNDIFNPPIDCCTQFVISPQGENTLRNAYFDVKSIKVFTPRGAMSKPSGTYMRGGVPLAR